MIFITSALEEIGQEGLLLSLKANEFYNGKNLMREEYLKIYSILTSPYEQLSISEVMKENLFLIIFYMEIEDNQEMFDAYSKKYLTTPITPLLKPGNRYEQMHFWFNLIEVNFKYPNLLAEDLKLIYSELSQFADITTKNFEEDLLMKYYNGVISYLIKQYDKCKEKTLEIIINISDKGYNDERKSALFKFIELKNSILQIKTMEMENLTQNRQEILSNLESLFERAKPQNEDFAIMIGIKMNNTQAANMDFGACSKLLDELLTLLHKKILFGKTNSNLIYQYLYVSAHYGYFQTLLGNNDQIKRSINKITKSLILVDEMIKTNSSMVFTNNNKNLLIQYAFFNLVLKQNENIQKNDQNKIITSYKTFLGQSIRERNDVLLNLFSINNFDNCTQYYMEKHTLYQQSLINQEMLEDSNLLMAYLYLYNFISSLTKSMVTDNNTAKQSEYNNKIRNYAKLVIDYTLNTINRNNCLRSLFQLNYFKELFIRIYFSYIYSYYHERKYNEVISEVNHFLNSIKFQFELDSGKSYYNMIQIKGDAMMKINNFKGALDSYNSILENCSNKALVNFKLGACNMMINNVQKGKQYFQYSQQLFSADTDKKTIDKMIKTINI